MFMTVARSSLLWHEQHQPSPILLGCCLRGAEGLHPSVADRRTRLSLPRGALPAGRAASIYSNGDTMQAIAAEGITYTIATRWF